ncbi:MAG: type I DNA topoisomerase [Alphaproteobacteria bacterium]|nr:type I DNA topoisomerase [Alphaproteobacteria bacterium]
MDVVVVESPTKAKTINKYLGADYKVLSSYGHVRDLPEKDGSVLPDEDFRMIYEPLADKRQRISEIAKAIKNARHLYLATDPDREGEAISWHLLSALEEQGAIKDVDVKRVVFHEITKSAVLEAMRNPRGLDEGLIDAYQARRALDYLVGFTLSPVLWRKLQGSRSAGRVQSVALRLICERENEIEAFVSTEYWSVTADFTTPKGDSFQARLARLDGAKLDKFGLCNEADAKRAVALIEAEGFKVQSIEKKQAQRHPSPPFSTSTLQQEAARKLGFGAERTMRTAQKLFEGINLDGETVGLITYMRTDSVQLSADALSACRDQIQSSFGAPFLPEKPRTYKTKTKNAQEAHEAIRPTDLGRRPDQIGGFLDDDQRRLYDLIWKRTLASQMASAKLDRVIAELSSSDEKVGFRAVGSTITFPGFLKVYQEGRDDPAQDDDEAGGLLPPMAPNDPLTCDKIEPKQHFTEPPPRYSEASLVKKLEELGIGRPSTYASIISVLQNRNYVRLESRRFIPEDRGRLVTAFLTAFFDQYVQPDFTALLEDRLDEVASGTLAWKDVLRDFWAPFHHVVDEVKERRVAEVIDALNDLLAARLFPPRPDGSDPRICQLCTEGQLSLKLGRYGAFVGCSNYPDCRYTRKLDADPNAPEPEESKDRIIGVDPVTSEEVILKHGPYGPYVQRGAGDDLKRSSLAPNMTPADLTIEQALALLALPREIGKHPESGEPIEAGINRYGPYIKHDRFVRLGADDDVLSIGMNRAIALIAEAGSKGRPAQKVLRELGEHPDDKKPVTLHEGRFGPYVKHGKINASLPKGESPESLTMESAVALLAAKASKGGKKPARRASAKTTGGKAKSGKAKGTKS